MALQKPPPEHWLIHTIRTAVGIPVFWLQLAVGMLAEYGNHFGAAFVVIYVLCQKTGLVALPPQMLVWAAIFLGGHYPAKWLYPEIDRFQRWFWPTIPHISEVPMAAAPASDHLDIAEGLPVVKAEPEPVPVALPIRAHVDPEEVQQTQRVGRI